MTEITDKILKSDDLVMRFDPNTIQHLGIQMYSTLPPVIAEIVANSYDADANVVKIYLNDNDSENKEIIISDDGHGLTYEQINSKFLKIGRNRRTAEHTQKSESERRFVIGKKGLGKLSFFGVASIIEVETVRDGLKNIFSMNLESLKKASEEDREYKPEQITKNEHTTEAHGTILRLKQIKRKSPFDPSNIAYNLAKYFMIFDEPNFNVSIIHNGNPEPLKVENKLKYEGINVEYKWKFPLITKGEFDNYEYAPNIKGEIISAKDTIPSALKGIALFSRGKLVNEHNFYDVKATSHGYSYLTGWLNIDFIDNWEKEVISTNRKSLNWEDEDTIILKEYLNHIIKFIYNEQRSKREESKKIKIKEKTGIDIDLWIAGLPKHERTLAIKIIGNIIQSEGIDSDKAGTLVGYVKDSFQFESFKELASEIIDIDEHSEDIIVKLLKEWELIEAKEFYKISLVRIKAISTFEKYINENAREVPTIHNFFKTLPWLLDPRIIEFKDEVYFSKLLKDRYPDSDEEIEADRRIDFLCTSMANNRFIIELKRPSQHLREKDLKQAQEYRLFVEQHSSTEPLSKKSVVAYIICGRSNPVNPTVRELSEMFEKEGKIFIRTYGELLEQARKFHSEFIETYEKLQTNIKPVN